jgi:hypothetical protein
MRQKMNSALLVLAGSIALGGCSSGSGEPSASEMLDAIRRDEQASLGLAIMQGGLEGNIFALNSPEGIRKASEVMKNAKLDKAACVAAQGSPGFVCDFKLGFLQPDKQIKYAPSTIKARFFKSDRGWQVSQT